MYRMEPHNPELPSPLGAEPDLTRPKRSVRALPDAQVQLANAPANRVATLGGVNASIMHEVRQPLAGIALNAQTSLRWLKRPNPNVREAIRAIEYILRDVERASTVTQQICALARGSDPKVSKVDINRVVKQAVAIINAEACNQRVSLQLDRASRLPTVLGDTILLQQVVMNLALNGIQAMSPLREGPRSLVIRTRRYDLDSVLVAVQDSGLGVETDDLDKLFCAFYSTKSNGMGLGLAISRSIIKAHDGRIWAARNAGSGMTFQFTIPIQPRKAAISLKTKQAG